MADDDGVSPAAEARVLALLALLRTEPFGTDPHLAPAIIRRARWELRVRHATHTLLGFAATLGGGLLMTVRHPPRARGS